MQTHGQSKQAKTPVAADYVSKPFQMEDVLFRISRALKERNLEKRIAQLESEINYSAAS